MIIHKVDSKRIYFIMDSGAWGSIAREDITKLCLVNSWLEKVKSDPREGKCLSEDARAFADAEVEAIKEEILNETFT